MDHIVISPYCLFVIETKNYNGEIKGKRTDQHWLVGNRYKVYRCRSSINPELRKIQSNELVIYDVELSEFISRKLLRLKLETLSLYFLKYKFNLFMNN
ncbi:nuclease-related domain-containing protein [Paenibacillus sp. FSL R7-0312]|uniref:nuclease-related domain-containing protein n=1 Tax=Paenibacillus sp. FSL R7-0312 TaxID=2921682 RepID=UPI0030F7FE40